MCWLIASSKNTIKTSEWTLPYTVGCFRGAFSQLRSCREGCTCAFARNFCSSAVSRAVFQVCARRFLFVRAVSSSHQGSKAVKGRAFAFATHVIGSPAPRSQGRSVVDSLPCGELRQPWAGLRPPCTFGPSVVRATQFSQIKPSLASRLVKQNHGRGSIDEKEEGKQSSGGCAWCGGEE